MSGFGAKFRAVPRAALQAAATPPSGRSQESIWDCKYDTQTFTSAATTRLTFFSAVNADKTLSNMESSGQFPSPQTFQIHNICADWFTLLGVSTSASNVGNLDDLYRLILTARPTWTLNISSKAYGPYPITSLHASGGPTGTLGTAIATPGSLQFARNTDAPGWNYFGRIIIPEQVSFNIVVDFGTSPTLTANYSLRLAMFGVLARRVV
jgi:hypothetical protein